jgi:hypothetical protein
MSTTSTLFRAHEGFPSMKTFILAMAAATLALVATPAAAQPAQDDTTISIIGTAEAFCTLPDNWQFVSSSANVSASQFSGHTWTIPAELVADTSGNAVTSAAAVEIRIRGQAACNTTHIIRLTSANGGLAQAASAGHPPAGFTRLRRMSYDANWRDTDWGIFNWIPSSAGDSITYDHGARVPPGNHEFDIRMGLLREPTNSPMLAGSYTDQLTVTITVPS